jgi:putative ABC transport system substrate-binding protein
MRERGYVEDKDFAVEWRFAENRYELFPVLAAELVRLKVEAIVLGTPAAIRPTQAMGTDIPLVMGYSTDPVGNGFINSLARPGGNLTGVASSLDDTAPKHLDLLKAVVPNFARVGLLLNPDIPRQHCAFLSRRISIAPAAEK